MRSAQRVALLLSAMLYSGTSLALPNLDSADGYTFDFRAEANGNMMDGESDSYDGCYTLTVNGTQFSAGGAHNAYYDGRGFETLEASIGDLRVRRYGFVPADGPSYARYIDVVRNEGEAPVEVTFGYYCNLGSDWSTEIVATASGNQTVEQSDSWIETDDADSSGDPSLGHVLYQPGAEVDVDAIEYGDGELTWSYRFSVGAGETAAIMIFAVQQRSRATAHEDVLGAIDIEDPALAEVGGELEGVRNFVLGGAPLISSGGPYEVSEGSCIRMTAAVRDREGDEVTLAWDLDGDGTYEHTEMEAEFCAEGLDGPSEASVSIRAEDSAGNVVERNVTIHVENVAPIITSTPRAIAVAGGHYEYQIEVQDPGGQLDPPSFTLIEERFPLGMSISATGLVTWDPAEYQANESYEVALSVDDGDEGILVQEFELEVRPNSRPSMPTPLYPTLEDPAVQVTQPTLMANNATDPDGDPLTYIFRIADNVEFSPEVRSDPIAQGDGGVTQWTLTFDLQPGKNYYWKVLADDGIEQSEEGFSSFLVDLDAAQGDDEPDAGPDAGDDASSERPAGCACNAPGSRSHGALASLLVAFAGLIVSRRRR